MKFRGVEVPALSLDLVSEHLDAAGQPHALGHPVIGRVRHQDPVALVDVAQENVEHGFAGGGGDDHLAVGIVAQAEVGLVSIGDGLS